MPAHNKPRDDAQRAERSHITANAFLVLLGLVFLGALVAYFVLARS